MGTKTIIGQDGKTYTVVDTSAPSGVSAVLNAVANAGPQASSYAGMGIASGVTAVLASLPPGTSDLAATGAQAALAGLSGNYVGAALGGVAFLSGLLAIVRNEATAKGLTDDQIKASVAALSHEQLISLLDGAAATINGGSGGNNSSAPVSTTIGTAVPTGTQTVQPG